MKWSFRFDSIWSGEIRQICDYPGRGGSRTAPQVSWKFYEENVSNGTAVIAMKRSEQKEGRALTTR
ncbi:hypothetical protein LTR22_028350, partial [Elasticomyces elasticus]